MTFFACLSLFLVETDVLGQFSPYELASTVIHSKSYPISGTHAFHVHPFDSRQLIAFCARTFQCVINVFICNSSGGNILLADIVGLECEGAGSWDQMNVCYVSDECLVDGVEREVRWVRKRKLGKGKGETRRLLSPSASRWILVRDPESFQGMHVCSHGCGSISTKRSHCIQHERFNCPINQSLSDRYVFSKIKYSQKACLPSLDLLTKLSNNGFHIDPWLVFVPCILILDLETELVPVAAVAGGWKQERLFRHKLFSAITVFAEDKDPSNWSPHSVFFFRAQSLDVYTMLYSMVGELLSCAQRQKVLMMAQTAGIRRRMNAELEYRRRRNPDGYFTKRMASCIRDFNRSIFTLVCSGWNIGSYDLGILAELGFIHILRSFFPSLNILMKEKKYLGVTGWNEEEEVGLRFVDALAYESPQSLANHLKSHSQELKESGIPGPINKTIVPYHHIQHTVDVQGQPTDFLFAYDHFFEPVRGVNSLNYDYSVYSHYLAEFGGDSGKAVAGAGLSCVPKPGQEVFAELEAGWAEQGLTTGYQVLCDYMQADAVPLAKLCLSKSRLIFSLTQRSLYSSSYTISSFMYNHMLNFARRGPNPTLFYGLGSRLTQLMRENLVGGLAYTSLRYGFRGQEIPAPRLCGLSREEKAAEETAPFGRAHEGPANVNQDGERMHTAQSVNIWDANSMFIRYGSCLASKEMLSGRPVVRLKADSFAGTYCDSREKSSQAQILAYLSQNMFSTPVEIKSEFSGGEVYISIQHSDHAKEIEEIWRDTIGRYLEGEREYKKRMRMEAKVVAAAAREAASGIQGDLLLPSHLSDPLPVETEQEVRDRLEEMEDFIDHDDQDDEDEQVLDDQPGRISSSSSSSSPATKDEGLPAKKKPDRYKWKRQWYRWRVDGLIEREEKKKSVGVDDIYEMSELAQELESELVLAEEVADDGDPNPRPLPPLPPLPPTTHSPSKRIIIELSTCGSGHTPCWCQSCPLKRRIAEDPDLLYTQKFFEQTIGKMYACDEFRLRVLALEHRVETYWTCEWNAVKAQPNSPVAKFCESFTVSPSIWPLDKKLHESQLLEAIVEGRCTGMILASYVIPESQRLRENYNALYAFRWSALPPLICKRSVSSTSAEPELKQYTEFHGRGKAGRLLCAQFTAKDIMLTTSYAKFLLLRCQAIISDIVMVVEMKTTNKLGEFVEEMVQLRRRGDATKSSSLSSFAKLGVNSSFGFSLLSRQRFFQTRLGTEREFGKALQCSRFYSATPVGGPRYRESLYLLSRRPISCFEATAIVIGYTVLNQAKVSLLRFYDQLTYFVSPRAFTVAGSDTDSLFLLQAHKSIHDCIRPELREEWDAVKWSILANPDDPLSLREPGLWKQEASGTSLVFLSSKLYSLYDEDSGKLKTAARALQRPRAFAGYLREHGLQVVGQGLLAPREEGGEDEGDGDEGHARELGPGSLLDWDTLSSYLDVGWERRAWKEAGTRALKWEEARESQRLQRLGITPPSQFPLSLVNVTFQTGHENTVHTYRTNKTLLLACYLKRLCLGSQGYLTIPLPEENE